MSKPLLTVAIPTYNRAETLEEILISLKKQDAMLFEILISDDSTTDAVANLVKNYQSEMTNLIYHRNPQNLGFNGNVCKLYELARTRYVWFLCDDETLYPNSISDIVACLEKHEPVVAVFNSSWEDSYGVQRKTEFQEKIYTREQDLPDYNALMRLTFLSMVVLEKRRPLDIILAQPDFKENVFVQLTISFYLLSDKFRFCEFSPVIVHRNVGYKYGEFLKFHMLDPFKAFYLVPHRLDKQKMQIYMIKNLPNVAQLYLSRKLGLFVFNGKPSEITYKHLREFYGPIFFYLILSSKFLLDLVPAAIVKFLYFIKLIQYHGWSGAVEAYKRLVNRAFIDQRDTGFTSYT